MSSGYTESFRSHANYLRAFAMLCTAPYEEDVTVPSVSLSDRFARLAPAVLANPSTGRSEGAQADLSQTRTSLINAWGTELLLALGGQVATDEELLRLMNNWAVVQAYYTSYHAIQALLVARGDARPESHPKTQGQFASLWAGRAIDLPPWTLGARDGGWCNLGSRQIDNSLNPWSSCDSQSCWSLAAKALRTTREDAVRDRLRRARQRKESVNRKAWDDEERARLGAGRRPRKEPNWSLPRLNADEKSQVHRKVRAYTILDYLYRLRIKTNYQDAAMFIEGPEDEITSRRVHEDLVAIAGCTLLAHELEIARIVGRDQMLRWADDWLGPNAHGQRLGLALRRDLIASQRL